MKTTNLAISFRIVPISAACARSPDAIVPVIGMSRFTVRDRIGIAVGAVVLGAFPIWARAVCELFAWAGGAA